MPRIYGKDLTVSRGLKGIRHSLYREDGKWYMQLKRFPGVLHDKRGYIIFNTESDFLYCKHIRIGQRVNIPLGISEIPGYVEI